MASLFVASHEAVRMILRHARLFCEVASRRSISAAAEACAIAQPTASQAILQLEQDLGVKLLDRSSRPLAVTPAGEVYAQGCRELLDRVSDLEDRVRQVGNQLAGEVRVAAIYSVGLLEIRTIVEEFERAHPSVSLEIGYFHPSDIYDRLRSGQADLGVIAFPRESGEFESHLWQTQQMVAVMAPSHSLAGRDAVRLGELHGLPFVALTKGLATRQHVDRLLKERGVRVREVGQFDNFDTLRRAVCDDTGITIAPEAIYRRDLESGLLAAVPIADAAADLMRPVGIVHRRQQRLSAAAKAFIEELEQRGGVSRAERKPNPGHSSRDEAANAAAASENADRQAAKQSEPVAAIG